MNDDIVIKLESVYKNFRLPHEKNNSFKSLLVSAGKNKNKVYEVQHALKDISFEVRRGEFFGIVGRNGSGKSTLLKIIAEIYQPTKGNLQRNGKLVPFIELGVGFNPELTGRENVYLNGALLGFSTKEIDAMYDDIVQFSELERFMDQKLKNYSSGMQVRLAFSVATRAKADILLIDEVLAVGDADFQRKCFEYFKQLKKSNTTVIFISHDMEAIRKYCDRVVLIDNTVVVKIGDPTKVADMYAELFLGKGQNQKVYGEKKGVGSVDIVKPRVKVKNANIQLSYDIIALTDLEDVLYGFSIKDSLGVEIIGSNSRLNRDPSLNLKCGAKKRITHSFDDILSDGRYYFDISVEHSDGTLVYCRIDRAVGVTIKKTRKLPGVLDVPIYTKVEEIKSEN